MIEANGNRFVLTIDQNDLMLANTPYNSDGALLLTNDNFDYWTEPGVLMPNTTWRSTGSSLTAGVDARILGVLKTGSDTNFPYWAFSSDGSNAVLLKRTAAAVWETQVTAGTMAWSSTAKGFNEFNSEIFYSSGSNLVEVKTPWTGSTSSLVTRNFNSDVSGAIITDILSSQEYEYISYMVNAGSRAGRIARYDGTTDINGAGMTLAALTLDNYYSPVGMAEWGDFIAITAVNTFGSDAQSGTLKSKLIIWDGINNTSEIEVPINDIAIQAPYVFNGEVWLFCAGNKGTIRVYKWSGGRAVTPVTTFNVDGGTNDLYIRKQAITDNGRFIQFGVSGTTSNRSYIYAVNNDSKGIHYTFESFGILAGNVNNIYCLKNLDTLNVVSTLNSNSNNKYFLETNSFGTYGQNMNLRTPIIYPSKNNQFKIDTIRLRYGDLTTGDTLTLAYNANQASSSFYTFTGTNLINQTIAAGTAGLGSGVDQIRTFTNPQGPIMDGSQFLLKLAPFDTTIRRIILPIVIEGEILNTPR